LFTLRPECEAYRWAGINDLNVACSPKSICIGCGFVIPLWRARPLTIILIIMITRHQGKRIRSPDRARGRRYARHIKRVSHVLQPCPGQLPVLHLPSRRGVAARLKAKGVEPTLGSHPKRFFFADTFLCRRGKGGIRSWRGKGGLPGAAELDTQHAPLTTHGPPVGLGRDAIARGGHRAAAAAAAATRAWALFI
jgi:hypothetical protein